MITRTGRMWPNGGMPPIEKPVSSSASRAVARRMSRSPVTAASRARSTRLGPDDEAEDRLEARPSPGRDEDERLDDLAELRADAPRRRPAAVCVDWSKTVTSSVDALPRGGVEDPLDPGVVGRSRARAGV